MMEYGECRAVGDKDSDVSSHGGERDGITFSQTHSGCHHEKLLLVAKRCSNGSIKPPKIPHQELPCQSMLGATDATRFQPIVKGCVSNGKSLKY